MPDDQVARDGRKLNLSLPKGQRRAADGAHTLGNTQTHTLELHSESKNTWTSVPSYKALSDSQELSPQS